MNACKGEAVRTSDLFLPFTKARFFHVTKGMAWMYLWVFLWGLIPIAGPVLAAIKLYTYRFVPYILMSRPEIRAADALQASTQETRGYRGKMFCADLLVALAVLIPVLLLGLLSMLPYIHGLFLLLLFLFCVAAIAFLPMVTGLLRAMFYDEIQHCLADPAYNARYAAPASPYIPSSVHPTPDPKPHVATEEAVSVRYCPVCGTPSVRNAKFCNNCGTSLTDVDVTQTDPEA